MALTPGTKLGPYEIQSPLGAGGMGEVYRARDARLDRSVAIKILPAHLSANPQAKQRFEREARAISSLNHPNICTLHDIGHQEGIDFLVMEHLEGETLAARLKKGPLSLELVLRYGMEIAAGLEQAHRSGVVHRDLKPGNVMITKTGAKLMDFGLAKSTPAVNPALSAMTASLETPAHGDPLTAEGAVVGTFHYMSPEQVEGKDADARSDIFALGAVLYEMATGKRAFEGKSAASVIAEVLDRDPPSISSLLPMSPLALDRLVQTCLAKDPNQRFQAVHDVGLQLEWVAEARELPSGSPAGKGILRRERAAWAAAIIITALVVGVAVWKFASSRPTAPQVTRFAIHLPPGESVGGSWWWYSTMALSPDGSHFAYVATRNGVPQLKLRALNELEARPLPETDNANTPFFSPDGQWLGFFVDKKLLKVPVSGGPPVTIATTSFAEIFGAAWAPDDTIYFCSYPPFGVLKVPARGGKPEPATKLDPSMQEIDHRYPEILPGGKSMLIAVRHADQPSFDEADIEAVSLLSGERHTVLKAGTHPRFAPSGHLLFVRAGVLLAAPFDPAKLQLTGDAVPVVENVMENPRVGAGQYSISNSGALVYLPGGVSYGDHEMVIVDHSGAARPLTSRKRAYEDFTLSPDGRFIAATIEGPITDTWVLDIARDTETRFTFGVEHRDPAWTADGKRIIYSGYRDNQWGLFWKRGDGSGVEERLVAADTTVYPWFCSPDGRVLVYQAGVGTGFAVWMLPLEGDRKPRPILQSRFEGEWASFSPDGKWLAFGSEESGRMEVYVSPFPDLGTRVRISSEGGTHPIWAPNGRELYYRTSGSMVSQVQRSLAQSVRIMAVPIELKPSFQAGKPHPLFEGPFFSSGHDYAITPDGRNFIFIRENPPEHASADVQVVLNWFEELKRRVPGAKQ